LVMARAIAVQAGVFIVLGVIQIAATAIIVFYATRYRGMSCPNHLPATPGQGQSQGRPQKLSPSPAGTARRSVNRRPGAPLRAGKPSGLASDMKIQV
jgi:hypothetical protein